MHSNKSLPLSHTQHTHTLAVISPGACATDGERSRWDVYLPMVEDGQSEGLALRVCAQVRLEAKRVDGRDEGLDGVEGRA